MLFGAPIIKRLQGETTKKRPETISARVIKNIPSAPGRSDYIRVRLEERMENGGRYLFWGSPVYYLH